MKPTATGQPADPRARADVASPASGAEEADPFGWSLMGSQLGFALRAPGRHPWLAGGAFAAVLAIALVLLLVMPVRYRVQTVVLTQQNALMSSLSNPGLNREGDVPTRAAREVVIRRDNLVAIARQVKFVDRYLAHRAPIVRAKDWLIRKLTGKERDPAFLLEAIVDTIQSRLWITATPEGTITITFEWSSPELALDVVDAALQTFLEQRHVAEIEAVGDAIAVLREHDDQLQRQIAATVTQVEEKERTLRIRPAPLRPRPAVRPRPGEGEELSRLETTLSARRRALTDLEAFRQQRLLELQSQLTQQQAIYAPGHPLIATTRQTIESLGQPSAQMLALRTETEDLESELRSRGRFLTPGSAPSVESEDFADVRLRLMQMDPRLEVERRRLEDLLRQHSSLLQRIDAARVEMDTAQAAFKYRYTVVVPAQMPKGPAKPYGLMYVASGILGGIAMALFAATAADLWSGRVVEPWQVERELKIPVLGDLKR